MKTAFLKKLQYTVVSDGDVPVISHIGVKPCTLFLWGGGALGSVSHVNDLFQSIVKNGSSNEVKVSP